MNWYSQLTHLIFSFYRENQSQLQQLQPLKTCKLSRRWGVMRVQCPNHDVAEQLIQAIDVLREPIIQLRLAQHIEIAVNRKVITTFPVNSSRLTM